MANKKTEQREQFSKKLAKWSSIFWFFYLTVLAIVLIVEPNSADATVYMCITVSIVMIVNVWAYTRNSIYEKGMYAFERLEKMKLTWKKGVPGKDCLDASEDNDFSGEITYGDEPEEDEGGGNG